MSDIGKPLHTPIITGRPDFPAAKTQGTASAAQSGKSFDEMLRESLQKSGAAEPRQLTFSKHAKSRTEQRGIELTDSDMNRLTEAVGKANDKGLTDTLVFMNNTAFIVNVPSKVVVTVVDQSEEQGSIFTNIDGAVIL